MPEDIQLSVGLKTEDIRNKAEALRASVAKMLDANVGNKLDSNLKQIMSQMQKLSAESVKLETQMGDLDRMHLSTLTQAMQEIETEITNIERTLAGLPSFVQNNDSVIREKKNLEDLRIAYETLRQEKEQVMAQGLQDLGFADYDQSANRLNEINNQLLVLTTRAQDAMSSTSQVGANMSQGVQPAQDAFQRLGESVAHLGQQTQESVEPARGAFQRLGESARNAFSALSGHITSSDKQINQLASSVGGRLTSAFHKVKGAIERAFSAKTIKRNLTTLIKYTVGVRSLYFLFRKLRNAVKEGLQNLVQYHSSTNQTNKAITELRTSLLYLKNAWASAFAPIINYVQPLLTSLIDSLAEVGNAIARFVGALTGQSKVLNAVKVNAGDYAKSLKGVGSSAKKAHDRLASFDDLNVLGKDSDAGGGGGASSLTPDPNEMFEYVDAVSEFADLLKDAWKNADFTEVGSYIKDKIIGVLQDINWDEVYAGAKNVGKSAGTFLNGLFGDPALWEEAGRAVAGGINTITYAVQSFLDETAKIDFGGNFATFVNEVIKNTDWATAGANINEFFTQAVDNINSFIDTLDTDELSEAIVTFTDGLNLPDLALKIFDCAINIVDGTIELGEALIEKFGQKLGENLVIYINKDRNIVFEDEGEIITVPYTVDWQEDPMGALGQSVLFDIGQWAVDKMGIPITTENVGELNEKFQGLIETVYAVVEVFSGVLFGPFGVPLLIDGFLRLTGLRDDVIGFFTAMGEVVSDLGDRIEEDLQPIKEWFDDIVYQAGLVLEGFSGIGEGLSEFWDNLIEGLKEFDLFGLMQEAGIDVNSIDLDNFWEIGGAIAMGILEGIGKALVNIPQWIVDNVFTPISTAFCDAFGIASPSTVFIEYGIDIIQGLLDGINSLINEVVQVFVDLKDSLAQKWEELKATATEKWRNINETIRGKVIELKNSIITKFVEIKDSVIAKILMLKDSAVQKFIEFKSGIYNVFSTIADTIKSPINTTIGVVENFVNKIIKGINKLFANFDGLEELASQVGLSVSVPTIPEITIPKLAQGAVIPPNKEFMAVLGDQKNGTNIEAPLDTIKQAVAEELSAQIGVLEQGFADVVNAINNKDLSIGDKQIGQANARYTQRQNLIRGTTF